VFTSDAATTMGLGFYPNEHIVFASDCPFDPEKGTMYIRETLRILDSADLPKDKLENIYHRNLETLTGTRLVK
jgi:aminocarboxymuconate-semialdehyde decarboxylase